METGLVDVQPRPAAVSGVLCGCDVNVCSKPWVSKSAVVIFFKNICFLSFQSVHLTLSTRVVISIKLVKRDKIVLRCRKLQSGLT